MALPTRYIRVVLPIGVFLLLLYTFRDLVLVSGVARYGPADKIVPVTGSGKSSWSKLPVRYPMKSLRPLPTTQPRSLPRVQHDFGRETDSDRKQRLVRQQAVKDAFEHCWKSYKKYAWMADELAPKSGGQRNHFGGWAASLVDSLDTLWIMDLKDDFELAVKAAASIDFDSSSLEEVNVFETTIRYLGGFLAGYDLSHDDRLLHKAIELGEMLIVAFDTPNRMPITRWNVKDARTLQPQIAHTTTLIAEIGSLTLEFTRLSQLTGDVRWYDAVDRVMRIFDKQQSKTALPGMWPILVNARDADFTGQGTYSLGAMADSHYEYLPKMHALLGGAEPMYERMYKAAMDTAIAHSLWRPLTPTAKNILLSGGVKTSPDRPPKLENQGQHLVCFAGGMFALGSRLMKDHKHLDIGTRLTDGCIWTYQALPMGIMPEVFHMSACPSIEGDCSWSEEQWRKDVLERHSQSTSLDDAEAYIESLRLPKGFTALNDRRYILRPEAIESVFILYRITGRKDLVESAWTMFESIQNVTRTKLANAAIEDISVPPEKAHLVDSMESFWMAETLKYFYLIFSEPDLISLDDYVFNTEAHPLRRPTATA